MTSTATGPLPPIHAEWLALWAPALDDQPTRSAILAAPRFAGRVEGAILRCKFGHAEPLDEGDLPAILAALPLVDAGGIRLAGLVWFAPVLAERLLRGADDLGVPRDRETLRRLLTLRHEERTEALRAPTSSAEIDDEGRACFAAWCRQFSPGSAARLTLRLPRALSSFAASPAPVVERAEAFATALGMAAPVRDAA